MEIRCGRESQHLTEGALGPPTQQLEIRCGRENQHPERLGHRPPLELPRRTGKKRGYGHKSEGQYVVVLFGLQLPLTHNPFK